MGLALSCLCHKGHALAGPPVPGGGSDMWGRVHLYDVTVRQSSSNQTQPGSVVPQLTYRPRRTQECCFKPLSLAWVFTPYHCAISLGWGKSADNSLTMLTLAPRHWSQYREELKDLHKSGCTDFPSSKTELPEIEDHSYFPANPEKKQREQGASRDSGSLSAQSTLVLTIGTESKPLHWALESLSWWHFSEAPEPLSLQSMKATCFCFRRGHERNVSVPGDLILLWCFIIMQFDLELELWKESRPFKQLET